MATGTLEKNVVNSEILARLGPKPLPGIELDSVVIPEELEHTSGHESNHMLAAAYLGVDFSYTVIPEGNNLGTTFLHDASLAQAQIILAGGSVSTHDGTAKGFGSDMFKVHDLSFTSEGVQPSTAQAAARSIINSTPIEVRRKLAKLVAITKTGSKALFQSLLARAWYEVRLERMLDNLPPLEEKKPEMPDTNKLFVDLKDLETEERTTTITHTKDGDIVRWYEGDKLVKEVKACPRCNIIGGHHPDCQILKMRVKDPIQQNPGFQQVPKSKVEVIGQLFPVIPPSLDKDNIEKDLVVM